MSRYLPKSIVFLRRGYDRHTFVNDILAGITVGIIALPLAMAFGIASIPEDVAAKAGVSPPAMGLYTAVVAGFLISALGGSRVQIGGPTGAFIVIVYSIASKHGYNGLAVATLMAGVIIIILGLARFGGMIKFIPYPVTTGFTTGIAVIIFSAQIKDFFGLQMGPVPAEFIHKWQAYVEHAPTWSPATFAIGFGSLAVLIILRRFAPKVPGAIVAVVLASAAVLILKLPVETIGSRFGDIPRGLPRPQLPSLSLELIQQLIPDATTIAMLAAIESLLSAVVADGMTGGRHKADCELVAQGVANVASVAFGGIPATGAIARTAANVKSGGRTPLAGIVHAITLLVIMVALGPLAKHIPLATLAAVLMLVAWNMSELDHFRALFRAPRSDVTVLLTTFGLTVLADLTMAVGVGMVLAALLFMKRMADVFDVSVLVREFANGADEQDVVDESDPLVMVARAMPPGLEAFEINGPFFFGVADRLKDTLNALERPPKVFILRMRRVPAIDATGLHALREFHHKCARQGTTLLLAGVQEQPRAALQRSGLAEQVGVDNIFGSSMDALARAYDLLT
jgi:SulP family sulfate permease